MRLARIQLKNIFGQQSESASRSEKGSLQLMLTLLPSAILGAWTLWLHLSVGRLQQSLTTEQLSLAVQEAKEAKIKTTYELSAQATPSPNRYRAEFSIEIENTSRKRLEVSWVVFELYLGEIAGEIPDNTLVSINEPPKRELKIDESGVVTWHHQQSRGFLYPGSHLLKYSDFASDKHFRLGGGLTKSLAPGDKCEYKIPMFVNARPESWVAVVTILGLDGAQEGDGVFYYSDWIDLASAKPPMPTGKTAE